MRDPEAEAFRPLWNVKGCEDVLIPRQLPKVTPPRTHGAHRRLSGDEPPGKVSGCSGLQVSPAWAVQPNAAH